MHDSNTCCQTESLSRTVDLNGFLRINNLVYLDDEPLQLVANELLLGCICSNVCAMQGRKKLMYTTACTKQMTALHVTLSTSSHQARALSRNWPQITCCHNGVCVMGVASCQDFPQINTQGTALVNFASGHAPVNVCRKASNGRREFASCHVLVSNRTSWRSPARTLPLQTNLKPMADTLRKIDWMLWRRWRTGPDAPQHDSNPQQSPHHIWVESTQQCRQSSPHMG